MTSDQMVPMSRKLGHVGKGLDVIAKPPYLRACVFHFLSAWVSKQSHIPTESTVQLPFETELAQRLRLQMSRHIDHDMTC